MRSNTPTHMESIHGHDVMHMVADSGRTFTQDELIAEIEVRFGVSARFHTCSAEDMTAAQLVDFLKARGKFSGPPEAMGIDPASICQH